MTVLLASAGFVLFWICTPSLVFVRSFDVRGMHSLYNLWMLRIDYKIFHVDILFIGHWTMVDIMRVSSIWFWQKSSWLNLVKPLIVRLLQFLKLLLLLPYILKLIQISDFMLLRRLAELLTATYTTNFMSEISSDMPPFLEVFLIFSHGWIVRWPKRHLELIHFARLIILRTGVVFKNRVL